jgi:photosystem II stability/assembly factor-like uncharacterized protein
MNNYHLKAKVLLVIYALGYAGVILMLSSILFSAPRISSKTLAATTEQLGTWNKVTTPYTYTLKSVDMTSSTDGWIGGFEGYYANGDPMGSVILHWNGSSWSRITSPNITPLFSIAMISATDGWAGGGLLGLYGEILRWDGSTWSEASHPSINGVINSLTMRSASDGWAVGGRSRSTGTPCYEGTILHWDGTSWSTSVSSTPDIYLRSVTAISANDVWVAGAYCHRTMGIPPTEQRGSVLGHWNGNLWNFTILYSPAYGFYSISAVASNDVWAVGYSGKIAHWDGTQWSNIQSPITYTLWSVAMTSPTDGWAVGDSQDQSVLHWDGNIWAIVDAPASHGLLDVRMLSSNEGWAVGLGGEILHYTNFSNLFLPLVIR